MNYQKEFGLSNANACIRGEKYLDKYRDYRDDYKSEYGVYPEFDIINNPFTACDAFVYDELCNCRRRGFIGAWYYHDLHEKFNKRAKKIYNSYKKEWSALMLSTIRTDYDDLPVSEHIIDNLGYRKDSNGNYYEGTWVNGQLTYGLVYFSSTDTIFVGKITYSKHTIYKGMCSSKKEKRNKEYLDISAGTFFDKKGSVVPYEGDCFSDYMEFRNDEYVTGFYEISKYKDGYLEGTSIQKVFDNSGDISIWFGCYKDGVLKYSMANIWAKLWRWYTGFTFMTMYNMMKFTYGLPILAIVRMIRKSNWQ